MIFPQTNKFKQNFWLTTFFIYQLFSTAFVATGMWPAYAVYVNLALSSAAVFLFDPEYALFSVILSVPFYMAIPYTKLDTLSSWRIIFALLFLRFALPNSNYKNFRKWHWAPWDKSLYWYLIAILLSLFAVKFPAVALKKLLFVLNIYVLYIVAANTLKTQEQLKKGIITAFTSLAAIVLLGFVQFFSTFTTSIYYFWQYWAEMISRVYYGNALSQTLTYSNSWFSFYKNAPPSLRMFSILPDSHAFALIAVFAIPFSLAILKYCKKNWQKILVWIFIVLNSWAIALSGTRGVWAAVLAPLVILVFLYKDFRGRKLLKPMFWPIIIFLLFLAVSPLTEKVFSAIRTGYNSGNFLERAESIYDLQESSNAGRLHIWASTLKFDAKHPLFGTGFGNFVITLDQSQNYQEAAGQKNSLFNLPNKYITAHNLYLDVLTETGLIGLAAFLYFIWNLLLTFWKYFKKNYLDAQNPLALFAASSGLILVWLWAYSLFDGTLLNDRVLIYFFLILAISASIFKEQTAGAPKGTN